MLTRRQLIKQSAWLAVFANSGFAINADGTVNKKKFHIGACDWSLGKNSNPAAFEIAKQIGVNGIMVDMGSKKNNLHLREKNVQQKYLDASRQTKIKTSSIAIGELNNTPYKSDPQT